MQDLLREYIIIYPLNNKLQQPKAY